MTIKIPSYRPNLRVKGNSGSKVKWILILI